MYVGKIRQKCRFSTTILSLKACNIKVLHSKAAKDRPCANRDPNF
jgi:hypothetical protein